MSGFINYDLVKEVERIIDAGVIKEVASDPKYDERHLSELYRIVAAMDDKEVYTVTKSLAENHRKAFVDALEELNRRRNHGNIRQS